MSEQIDELMVDIYEAEIYLRNHEHKSRDEVRKILKETFGPEVYHYSRKYVQCWISQAASILENQLVPRCGKHAAHQEAEKYRHKWLDAPFTHRMTLTKLPQYQWNSLGIGIS